MQPEPNRLDYHSPKPMPRRWLGLVIIAATGLFLVLAGAVLFGSRPYKSAPMPRVPLTNSTTPTSVTPPNVGP